MKYFLGYKTRDGYVKINHPDFKESLKNIIDYTTSFADYFCIIEDLYENNLITSKNIKLEYLYEKKGELTPLKESNKIYTTLSSDLFRRDGIIAFINKGKEDDEFLNYLYSCILSKYGYLKSVKELFYFNIGNKVELLQLLRDLVVIPLSIEVKNELKKIIELILSKNYSNDTLYSMINDLIVLISKDNVSHINTYKWSKKYVKFPNIPTLYFMSELYDDCMDYKNCEDSFNDALEIKNSISNYIRRFVDSLIYTYDKSTKQYKKDYNGNIKISERGLFYLGSILDNYQDYMINVCLMNKQKSEDLEYDEEFLEEEDFRRLGTSSEEQGIKLRVREDT